MRPSRRTGMKTASRTWKTGFWYSFTYPGELQAAANRNIETTTRRLNMGAPMNGSPHAVQSAYLRKPANLLGASAGTVHETVCCSAAKRTREVGVAEQVK